MVRPTFVDLNPVESIYYPFMIGIDECSENCNVSSPKICVLKETKDINVKAFNMTTNKNEARAVTKHISRYYKFKFNSVTFNSNQKSNNKTCWCACKNYCKCEKRLWLKSWHMHL